MRIYVGNLAYGVTDNELKDVFSQHGELVSAEVVKDKYTGQSKGFGFVDMPDSGSADRAIRALNDTMLKGRKLTVNEARPRPERPMRRFR